ncbi:MAG: hypothetical protein POELPBGB_01125 [Bacteroidia bacterium]|nr:hypothetical protein [Bacteroidia bacterium]
MGWNSKQRAVGSGQFAVNGKCKSIILLLAVIISQNVLPQGAENNIDYGNQQWVQYYSRIDLGKKFTLLNDASLRVKESFTQMALVLVRSGLAYSVNEHISVAGGVCATFAFTDNNASRMELRGWEELFFPLRSGRLYFSNRLRLEQRYFRVMSNGSITNDESYFNRLRYRLYVTIPLNHKTMCAKTIALNVGDEVMVNFGQQVKYNAFDTNRLLAGLSFQVTEQLLLSLNYMLQLSHPNVPLSFEENNIVWLQVTHSINKHKP